MGVIFLALEPWSGGPDVELGFLALEISTPKFLSTPRGCGISPFHISASPSSLDGGGFSNSVVVRLPFTLISDGSE